MNQYIKFTVFFIILTCSLVWLTPDSYAQDKAYKPDFAIEVHDPFRNLILSVPLDHWDVRVEDLLGTTFTYQDKAYKTRIRILDSYISDSSLTIEQVWEKKLKYYKKTKPGYVYIKEKDEVTIGGHKAMGMIFKDPSTMEISRVLYFKTKNKYRELSFLVQNEALFKEIKSQLKYILKNIRIPKDPVKELILKDSYLGVHAKAPGTKEWGFETEVPYKRFYYIPSGQYKTRGKVNIFNSIYSDKSAKAANDEWIKLIMEKLPTAEFTQKSVKLDHNGTEMYFSTFKNPSAKTVVRGINFKNKTYSVMTEFIVEQEYLDKVKTDFSFIMKNIEVK